MTVTAAAGTAALVESVTWPRIALVVSPWAHARVESNKVNAAVKRAMRRAWRTVHPKLNLTVYPRHPGADCNPGR